MRHPALPFCSSMIFSENRHAVRLESPDPPHWLPRNRMPGRQHADKPADVGVPDTAVAIDGDAERPGIIAGKRKDLDVAVAQPPEARAAHHAKPHVVIRSHSNAA